MMKFPRYTEHQCSKAPTRFDPLIFELHATGCNPLLSTKDIPIFWCFNSTAKHMTLPSGIRSMDHIRARWPWPWAPRAGWVMICYDGQCHLEMEHLGNLMSFWSKIDGPVSYTIYHHWPVIKGFVKNPSFSINQPMDEFKGHLWIAHFRKPPYMICMVLNTNLLTGVHPFLVCGLKFEPLWKILVNWDDYSQYMGKQKMFQTTNQEWFHVVNHLLHVNPCF